MVVIQSINGTGISENKSSPRREGFGFASQIKGGLK